MTLLPTAGDAGALVQFFDRLSEESRSPRFHGARHVDRTLVEPFLDPDWVDRGALVASLARRDHTGVAASLRPIFTPRPVAVIGASRRRGSIGGELFRNILAADFAGAAHAVKLLGAQALTAAAAALRRGIPALS